MQYILRPRKHCFPRAVYIPQAALDVIRDPVYRRSPARPSNSLQRPRPSRQPSPHQPSRAQDDQRKELSNGLSVEVLEKLLLQTSCLQSAASSPQSSRPSAKGPQKKIRSRGFQENHFCRPAVRSLQPTVCSLQASFFPQRCGPSERNYTTIVWASYRLPACVLLSLFTCSFLGKHLQVHNDVSKA